MKTNINITIASVEDARNFLTDLCNNDEAYHPDDSAHGIVQWDDESGESEPLFTEDEADKLDELMEKVFGYVDVDGFCPYGHIMDLGDEKQKDYVQVTCNGVQRSLKSFLKFYEHHLTEDDIEYVMRLQIDESFVFSTLSVKRVK